MKIVRFETDTGISALGIAEGDAIISLEEICPSFSMFYELMADEETFIQEVLQKGPRYSQNDVRLKVPLDQTATIFCVAANYSRHALELGVSVPQNPLIFNKIVRSMVGPGEGIMMPAYSTQIDYEGELAVMIGRSGFAVNQAEAMEYVGGYACLNDITARDRQWTDFGENRIIDWFSSKMMEGSTPLGPWIVLRDEIPDPHALRLQTRVNGRTVQDESTARMVFQIPALIEYISSRVVLHPGDIIATGTPFGVGGYEKPIILKQGDTVEVEIEGIGTLTNKCL